MVPYPAVRMTNYLEPRLVSRLPARCVSAAFHFIHSGVHICPLPCHGQPRHERPSCSQFCLKSQHSVAVARVDWVGGGATGCTSHQGRWRHAPAALQTAASSPFLSEAPGSPWRPAFSDMSQTRRPQPPRKPQRSLPPVTLGHRARKTRARQLPAPRFAGWLRRGRCLGAQRTQVEPWSKCVRTSCHPLGACPSVPWVSVGRQACQHSSQPAAAPLAQL